MPTAMLFEHLLCAGTIIKCFLYISANHPNSPPLVVIICSVLWKRKLKCRGGQGFIPSHPVSVDTAGMLVVGGGGGVVTTYLHGGCCWPTAPAGDPLLRGGLGLSAGVCQGLGAGPLWGWGPGPYL